MAIVTKTSTCQYLYCIPFTFNVLVSLTRAFQPDYVRTYVLVGTCQNITFQLLHRKQELQTVYVLYKVEPYTQLRNEMGQLRNDSLRNCWDPGAR